MTDSQLHVVFGAGQIGPPLARILRDRGHRVRIVRRSSSTALGGIEVVAGDASDPAFATHASQGAAAIYHCLNPEYSAKVWAEQLPKLADSLIAAAAANHARLVVLDNLYPLDATRGAVITQDTPPAPVSRKGTIRRDVQERYMAAHRAGRVRYVSGRGPDFFGPGGDQTHFGAFFWQSALKSGKAQVLVPTNMPHAFAFTHDIAAGLATLGTALDDVTGQWWMLPSQAPMTVREMVAHFATALGRPLEVQRMPGLLRAMLPLFMPVIGEFREMAYQWDAPYVVDDAPFRTRFGVAPTPIEMAAALTVEWAKQRFGAK